MDLTAIIFVALFVAWAVYLIPKAVKHHDEVSKSRSVDRFSNTMRVLARRQPVPARVVVTPGRAEAPPVVTTKGNRPSPAQLRARREAARRATARRRRVLVLLLLANAVVAGLAFLAVFGWIYQAVPGGLVVVWLVLCRVMVKSEIRAAAPLQTVEAAPVDTGEESIEEPEPEPEVAVDLELERNDQGFEEVAFSAEDTGSFPAVAAGGLWDPLPVTLPTYVNKATARRTVRTISLGEPGAWTSGHSDESSAIARDAEAAEKAARTAAKQERRATGS